MRVQLKVKGLSQYDESIKTHYQNSACGPVTALTILRYWMPNSSTYDVNQLYRLLQTTRIGLFTWRLKHNLGKLLGSSWEINTCSLEEAKSELIEGRPVACKFDRYFTFHWFGTYEFAYHWVPMIGFEENENDLTLILHDNGGRNRESRIRHVSYKQNQDILTFVKMYPYSKMIE
ncbi:C39 family peptidase [Paenisporosarcina indica]|uniref:C39 family peptidase n=1 Tax=Paenisporosarcina indica TaxID=650093 RepID=UPI00094F6CDB|nr:C39 family peptidase [Paenisporosarcina indica]